MSTIFVMPTLWTRPALHKRVLDSLYRQIHKGDRIIVAGNTCSDGFVGIPRGCDKLSFGPNTSAPRAINLALELHMGEEYICVFHDDLIIKDDAWLSKFIDKFGIGGIGCIGIQLHSNSKPIPIDEEQNTFWVDWSDGVMLIPSFVWKRCGEFDERMVGDCDPEDYCIRLRNLGYSNLCVQPPHEHHQQHFQKKNPSIGWLKTVNETRKYFCKKHRIERPGWS